MAASRGLQRQAQANAEAERRTEFVARLLLAMEDPEVAQAVADALRVVQARKARRTGSSVTSAGAARDLKAQRLAARGRR